MEEERARQEAAAKKAADEAGQKDKDGDTASASQETVARTTEKSAEPMVSCYSFNVLLCFYIEYSILI